MRSGRPAGDPTSEMLARRLRSAHRVVASRELRETSARLVLTSRERISAARATIAPWLRRRIAGGGDGPHTNNGDGLTDRVRDLLARGVLPRELVNRVWAGRGTGVSCIVCDKPIDPMDVEFEIEGIHLHRPCHSAWIRVVSAR